MGSMNNKDVDCLIPSLLHWWRLHKEHISSTLHPYYNPVYNDTVEPVCNDHLYNKIYYLWFIQ